MDPRLLRAFVCVAQTSSVTLAAKHLNYSPARTSQHIHMMESLVGAKLFQRTADGMMLTPPGEQILPLAEVILHALSLIHRQQGQLEADSALESPKMGRPPDDGLPTVGLTRPAQAGRSTREG